MKKNKDGINKFISSDLFIAFIYLTLCFAFFHKVFIHPDWIVFGTDTLGRYTWTNFMRETVLNDGQFPLWASVHFSGLPHIEVPHTIYASIFCIFYYIFPLPLAFNLFMIIHFFFAGFFTYIFAKEIGYKKYGAFVSGLIFMFSGVLISYMYVGHFSKIAAFSFTPLALFLVSRGMDRRRLLYFLMAGLVIGHQFIGYHMQINYYSTLFISAFALFKVFSCRKNGETNMKWLVKPASFYILTLVIAVLLYSVLLVPGYLFTQNYTERSGGTSYEYSTSWSFAPQELPGMILKDPYGWAKPQVVEQAKHVEIEGGWPLPKEHVYYWGPMPQRQAGEYVGVLPFILVIIGAFYKRNRSSWFFVGAAIITLLLSMGKYTPVFWLAYKLIFGFSYFRVPLSIFPLTAFSLAILAGKGADYLLEEKAEKKAKEKKAFNRFFYSLFIVTGIAFVILIIAYMFGDNYVSLLQSPYDKYRFAEQTSQYGSILSYRMDHLREGLMIFALYCLLSTVLIFLQVKGKLKKTITISVIVLVILADLWGYGYDYIKYMKVNEDIFYGKNETVKFLKKDNSKFRALTLSERFSGGGVHARALNYHGIELVDGRHDLIPIYYQKMYGAAMRNPKLLSLLNAKYIVLGNKNDISRYYKHIPNNKKRMPLILQDEDLKLYENKDVLPRAFFAKNIRLIKDSRYVLNYMMRSEFNPRNDVVLEERPDKLYGDIGAPALQNKVTIERYTPNNIKIKADLKEDGILVLADTYYPAWKVYIDGVEGKIYKADYALRGVPIVKGSHSVEFVYDSKILNVFGTISLITFLLTLSGIVFICWRERNAATPVARKK